MSDEVKSAADRLRLVNSGESPLSIYGQFWSEEIAGDYAVVANAYLAEHANDAENATLLTAEILRASGWYFSVALAGYTHIDIEFALHGPYEVFAPAWHAYAIEREFGTIKTVGDLRNLLEALHIPAVVTVPNGGE